MVQQKKAWMRGALAAGLALLTLTTFPAGATGAVQIDGGTVRIHDAVPGETVEATLVLRNDGSGPRPVRIYVTDYVYDARDGWSFPDPGTLPRSNAPWVQLLETDVVLAPGESRGVPYRVVVPDDLSLRGTYWGSIMVEPARRETGVRREPGDPEGDAAQAGVKQVLRYQVALIIDLPSDGGPVLAFHEPSSETGPDGASLLKMYAENIGEARMMPDVWMEIYDDAGVLVRRVSAGRPHILPGTFGVLQFDVSGMDSGQYEAVVLADAGGDAVFGTRLTLRFAAGERAK